MKIEDSFMKALGTLIKKNPVLKHNNGTKVQISVGAIVDIGRQFHAEGFNDGANNDPFDELLRKISK